MGSKNSKVSGFKLLMGLYLIVLAFTMTAAFIWVVPGMKEAQIEQCDMIESGLSQIGPEKSVQPMTAEQCKANATGLFAGFVRAFIAVFGSMVVAAFATAIIIILFLIIL